MSLGGFITRPGRRHGAPAGTRRIDCREYRSVRVSVMLVSCGNSMQPAAEADERADGPVDVPDPVQQPTPAAQRPRVGQMRDGLLDQRTQPCLQAVVGPLPLGEAVDGAPVPDGRVPVLARL